jgi:hypothetical protein
LDDRASALSQASVAVEEGSGKKDGGAGGLTNGRLLFGLATPNEHPLLPLASPRRPP